jgi:hypothetical protein
MWHTFVVALARRMRDTPGLGITTTLSKHIPDRLSQCRAQMAADVDALDQALAESHDTIPWDQVKEDLGLR